MKSLNIAKRHSYLLIDETETEMTTIKEDHSMDESEMTIVRGVIEDLRELGREKPWKSVRTLAGKFHVQESYMREILLEYVSVTKLEDLEIRYSHYPSKKSLDMIWAHTKNIQQLEELYDFTRLDEPDRRFAEHVEDYPSLFLSHSHKNGDRALYLRDFLLSHGVNTWMAELDILAGQDIYEAINQGRKLCSGILADVTEESLQSVWVQKEFLASIQEEHAVYVVLDGTNGRLIEACSGKSPQSIKQSLQRITTVFEEYFQYLENHVRNTQLVLSFPYVEGEVFGNTLMPLAELINYLP